VKEKFVELWNIVKEKFVEWWKRVKGGVVDNCSCIKSNCGCCLPPELIKYKSKIVVVTTFFALHKGFI
jgi:hypothetical protein